MSLAARLVPVVVALVLLGCGTYVGVEYSALATASEKLDAEAAALETEMQRKFDLVPVLGKLTENVSAKDRAPLLNATAWRSAFSSAAGLGEKDNASVGVSREFATFERIVRARYPGLARTSEFDAFAASVNASRARVVDSKAAYNADAAVWNEEISHGPASLVAAPTGFARRAFVASEPPLVVTGAP